MKEVDDTHAEVCQIINIGNRLHVHIGGDRPDLEKYIEDIADLWQSIYDQCFNRLHALNNMLAKATTFHEQLMVRFLTVLVGVRIAS